MWKQPTTLLLLLCAPLMVATAQYCTDEYSAEQRYTVENVAVLSINKLNNTVVMFSQDTTAAALDDASVNTLVVRVYDNNTVESVADYVTVNWDVKKKSMVIDSKGDDVAAACIHIMLPAAHDLAAITVEGQAAISLGPITNMSQFGLVVNNGRISSNSSLHAIDLEVVVNGNGIIDLAGDDMDIDKLMSSIIGRGNISVTGGSLTRVEVQNQGTGNTDLGVVTDAVDVKLAGSGNTTIEGSADLVVRGTSQPVNYLFVQQGLCNVTSGDQNFKPCMFSAMQETQPSNSLSLAG